MRRSKIIPGYRSGTREGKGKAMSIARLVVGGWCVVLVAACAGLQGGPAPEVKQALAPSGSLRVALFTGSVAHVVKDPASGETRGVGHDLGKALAARLGVPFEPVLYSTLGPMLDGAKAGAWDVAFVGMSPERSSFLDFTSTHMEIDFAYLVPSVSRFSAIGDVDRPGVRIAVLQSSSPDVFLTRTLKHATLVRTTNFADALLLLKSGDADVLAGLKPTLYGMAAKSPGLRVLDGRPGAEEQALAVPKGRNPAALVFARNFIEDAKAAGLVKTAIDHAGLRGAIVAPLE